MNEDLAFWHRDMTVKDAERIVCLHVMLHKDLPDGLEMTFLHARVLLDRLDAVELWSRERFQIDHRKSAR